MGGAESVTSMGFMILFLIVLYLAGVGISSLVQFLKKKVAGTEKMKYTVSKKYGNGSAG